MLFQLHLVHSVERNECQGMLKCKNLERDIAELQYNILQHIYAMKLNGMPKQTLEYKPLGRETLDTSGRAWRYQLH